MPEKINNLEEWKPLIAYAVNELLLILNTQHTQEENMQTSVLEQRVQDLEDRMSGFNDKIAVRKAFTRR